MLLCYDLTMLNSALTP